LLISCIRSIDDHSTSFEDDVLLPVENIIVANQPKLTSHSNSMSPVVKDRTIRIIHIFVPLCDNKNQGIVPVNASLGNGQNLRTNLYWGAGYGIKTHFNKSTEWLLIYDTISPDSAVLERLVFKHFRENVFLIADAFDGGEMEHCLRSYFRSCAGQNYQNLIVKKDTILFGSSSDLLIFNGHNGLMDVDIEAIYASDSIHRDAVVIACYSHSYFSSHLQEAGAFPVVCTTHLLAPEAYVAHAICSAWVAKKSTEDVRYVAGEAYHKIQKCGARAADRLFISGW
jgi:hypothetical protein